MAIGTQSYRLRRWHSKLSVPIRVIRGKVVSPKAERAGNKNITALKKISIQHY